MKKLKNVLENVTQILKIFKIFLKKILKKIEKKMFKKKEEISKILRKPYANFNNILEKFKDFQNIRF